MAVIPRHRIEMKWGSLLLSPILQRTENVRLFREGIESYFDGRVLLLQSGRAALYYLLKALPQETVIMPGYTCKVVPEAALLAGKKIIYVDIDLETLNMDLYDLEKKIEPQSIILATHQFGIPCDIEKVNDIAQKHRSVLIEDCAAAFGSRMKEKLVGTGGLASLFSFEFTKVLSAGRGGFILFRDEGLYEEVRRLTSQGLRPAPFSFVAKIMGVLFFHKVITVPFWYGLFIKPFYRKYGFSTDRGEIRPSFDPLYQYSLSPMEATLGLMNLKRVERILRRRWEIACQYDEGLGELKGLRLPVVPAGSFCSWMRFPARVLFQDKRDFYSRCLVKGLDLGFTYSYSCSDRCANAQLAGRQVVNLPLNSSLKRDEVIRIIRIVRDVIQTGQDKVTGDS